MKITRPTHTSLAGVGDLTTSANKLIVKLVDSSNNNISNLLHNEDANKFVQCHIKEQAKSSAKYILGNLYNNIYNAPEPSTQSPQSYADGPTISIDKKRVRFIHTRCGY